MPPGMVACKRFRGGARWLIRILKFKDRRSPVPHSQDVRAPIALMSPAPPRRIEVDASPWGGGGILYEDGRPCRCFSVKWKRRDFKGTSVQVGEPASQTYFEILVLVLATELWCLDPTPCTIFGDNVAALQAALALKGRGDQLKLIQALAVIRSSRTLELSVAHLPSEANEGADALSRQFGPVADRKPWPSDLGTSVTVVEPISATALWALAG